MGRQIKLENKGQNTEPDHTMDVMVRHLSLRAWPGLASRGLYADFNSVGKILSCFVRQQLLIIRENTILPQIYLYYLVNCLL